MGITGDFSANNIMTNQITASTSSTTNTMTTNVLTTHLINYPLSRFDVSNNPLIFNSSTGKYYNNTNILTINQYVGGLYMIDITFLNDSVSGNEGYVQFYNYNTTVSQIPIYSSAPTTTNNPLIYVNWTITPYPIKLYYYFEPNNTNNYNIAMEAYSNLIGTSRQNSSYSIIVTYLGSKK
jgi:hypothetical protein